MNGGNRHYFIYVQSACQELKIINENHLVDVNCWLLLNNNENAVVTFEKGTYKITDIYYPIRNRGEINLNAVGFDAAWEDLAGSAGIILNLYDDNAVRCGRIYIRQGTRLESHRSINPCISGGTVNICGGTITATLLNDYSSARVGIVVDNVTVDGGTIENFNDGIRVFDKGKIIIGGKITFKNNNTDIYLGKGNLLTIKDNFEGTVNIDVNVNSFPHQITTPGTSRDMRAKITCNAGPVNYDIDGKYLYIGDHNHLWSYSKNDNNKIIATCTAKEDCEHNSGKLDLILTATDEYYSGKAYTGATVTNNITYATDAEASIAYYKDGALTNNSNSGAASEGAAPVNPGDYTVKVTLGGQTISADFKIRIEINPTVTIDGWTYGQDAKAPTVKVESGGTDITTSYKESQITYTYYTDENCTNVTTAANGASANGEVPKNAGTYYVKADVKENGDYAADSTAAEPFTINKLAANLAWENVDLTYTGTAQSVLATVENAVPGDTFAITYEGNTQTEVGDSYTATVTGLGNDNYTLTGATGVSQKWSISYLQTQNKAEPFGKKGNGDWFVSAVKLVPNSGYQISADKTKWIESLGDYVTQGQNKVEYYLKEIATGSITDKKTASFKIDTEMPTGEIKIEENKFSSSLNSVTYGYWFKNNAAVDITGADSTSGIASIEYQKVEADKPYNANGTWNAVNKLSLTESGKYVIYARITDNAGNQTIINSDGVVVFKDSAVVDSSIDYTRTTKASVDAEVTLNGNTVASVKNGETTLTAGKDYTVSADKITFSGEYLDTLEVGSYTLIVAYNPQGVTEYTGGDKPGDSQITVNVKRQAGNIKITSDLNKEYDGQPADLVYTTNSNANVKVEYKVNGTWQTEAPTHAGTYEVKVSVPENGDFTAVSDMETYTIKQREVEICGITANAKVYDGNANAELDYSKAVFTRLIEGDTLTVSAEGAFADSNAAKGKNVTITNLVLGGASADNYVLAADGQQTSTTADINPKEITVTITPNGGTYEETITPATAVLNGLVGADKPEITLTYTGTANDGTKVNGTQVPSLAGTYTVTASIIDDNYILKPEGATAEFVIAKAAPVLNVSPVADKIYGDEAFKLEASHKGNGAKTYASSNDKVTKIDENGTVTITGAGTATLTIALAESANYTADRKSVTVTVKPKEITVTADSLKKIIGEADPVLTYTADGLVGEDILSGIALERKAGEKVGTYAVTASQAAGANPNYRITFKKGTFTIQQADQSRMKGKYVYSLRLPSFFAKGKAKKSSVALSWKKYAGADGYDVFWRYCDGSINYERAGTVKNGKLSMTHKKLKNDREYKYFIAAYKMVEGRKIYIAKSNGIHVAMKQASRTNAVSIKVNRTKVTLKAGKTFKLKCEVKPENSQKKLLSHSSVYSLSTSNSRIATVNKNGVIEAKAKGTCGIYVLANNGVYKRVKVTVK